MESPKVGVAVIIKRERKVLLGKRIGSHGANTWAFPGGHLEFNEEPEDTATREVDEEVGVTITNIKRGPFTNDLFKEENKHYVTLFVTADWESGEAKVKEPDRAEKWDWFAWDEFPEPLFFPVRNLIKADYNPFEQK